MKFIYLGLVILLILPSILAFDESLIKSELKISWERNDNETGRFRVQGENLDWSKSFDLENGSLPENFNQDLEIIMLRQFGNYSEVQYSITQCESLMNDAVNFSKKWEDCSSKYTDLKIMVMEELTNKTEFDLLNSSYTEQITTLEASLNTCNTNKQNEISPLNAEIENLKKQRQWGWIIAIIAGATSIYLLNKYRGFGRKKHEEELEFPKDVRS